VRRIFARLVPQSLAGQIIALVAIALFVAQAINFGLLVRERERLTEIGLTAGAVSRIAYAYENPRGLMTDADVKLPRDRRMRMGQGWRQPVITSMTPPEAVGERRTDIEERALELLRAAGIIALSARAYERTLDGRSLPPITDRRERLRRPDRRADGTQLTLGIEHRAGQWSIAQTRDFDRRRPIGFALLVQTSILYIVVLLPLLWVGRRLGRPLKDLTATARQFASTGSADPVEERGPGDVRDLTTAFNAMRARLLGMLDEKDRMLGAIGHDLRTPLASLRVRAESVEDEVERERMADTIEEMNHMLDDILSLARAGRGLEAAQKTDLAALCDAVVEDYIDMGQPVAFEEAERLVIAVRPQLIRRALRNLIDNAVKYGERAEVSVMREGDKVVLSVADHGPGIATDRMAEMTEAFTRLESSRNRDTGGAGLGLALVKAIMADHRGELRLANRAEGGLVASLVLPG